MFKLAEVQVIKGIPYKLLLIVSGVAETAAIIRSWRGLSYNIISRFYCILSWTYLFSEQFDKVNIVLVSGRSLECSH